MDDDRRNDEARDERNGREDKLGQTFDLVKTPFYAWIGAGVRTAEILGDIGARVRAEEGARDAGADPLDDAGVAAASADDATTADPAAGHGVADSVADRMREARRRVRDMGDNVGEQSRDAFLKALDAAQLAFNDALTKAQAGGDRAFASAHTLPEDVSARAEQLKPEHLRAVADGYLEAASKIYRELATRGEQAVDEGVNVAKERGGSFEFGGFPGARARTAEEKDADGSAGTGDPVSSLLGKIPFAGAAAERVGGSIEDVARETVKPFQDAGAEFLGRFDQEKISTRVEDLLHQAADVTEQLLGALRAEEAAVAADAPRNDGDVVDADPDIVDADPAPGAAAAAADAADEADANAAVIDGEVVDLDGSENLAGAAVDADAADGTVDAEETIDESGNAGEAGEDDTAR